MDVVLAMEKRPTWDAILSEIPTVKFHRMRVLSGTASLRVCSVLHHPTTPTGCVQAVFQSAAQLDSWSCETNEILP